MRPFSKIEVWRGLLQSIDIMRAQIIDTCGQDGPRIVKSGSLEDCQARLKDLAGLFPEDRILTLTKDHLQVRSAIKGYTANYIVVTTQTI